MTRPCDAPTRLPRADESKIEAMLRGNYDPQSDEIVSCEVLDNISEQAKPAKGYDFRVYCLENGLKPISGYRGDKREIALMSQGLTKYFNIGSRSGRKPSQMPVWKLVQKFNEYYIKYFGK